MNHIYRLCWNRTLRAWVPASELAKGKGSGTSRSRSVARVPLMLSLLSASLGMSGLAWAGNAPTGGQIVGGSGSITQSGNVTTIRQDSQTLSLDWQSFDVGADQTVDFLQPGRSSIAVNRILGNTASEIYGHLNANGQVWLINPNGVLFGQNAQVNVGGIVASTLDLDDSTLGSGTVRFAGNGRGSVVNRGSINAAPGGYVALLGNTVSNQGAIRAQLGTVALGAGTAVTLTFADSHLMHLVVDASTVRSLVENRQLIVADGGSVLMTAGARNSLIASVVNNTGTVQAQTVQDHDGTITLLGGMEAGTVNVGGTLDASAPNGGKGGQIETSAANFNVAADAHVTAASPKGTAGTWLVDPTNLNIDATAASAISGALNGGTGVTETTSASGAPTGVAGSTGNTSSGNGDINVNAAINWNTNATLTLNAYHNINLNAAIKNTGAGGKTVLEAGNAFINTKGANALVGNWAVYSQSPGANTLGGLTPGFIQYNAAAGAPAASGATGNGLFYSAAATINIAGFNAGTNGTPSKSYDGTSNLLVNELNYSLAGGGSGDTLTAIAGGYGQSDAGTGLTVTAPTASAAYTILNGAIPVYGYTVSGSASVGTGAINPATLTISIVGPGSVAGANSLSKVYDGTNAATLNSLNYLISGLVAGQSITVNQPSQVGYGTVSGNSITPVVDVNTVGGTIAAGGGGPVPISAIFTSTNFVAGSGTKLSNYNLTGLTATGTGAITQAPVYLSGVVAQNKTYDTGTSDPLDISNASIYGIVNGDSVTLDTSNGAGNFADANAGSGKAVTLSGFALTGSNPTKVADYNLILPTNLTASIAKAQLQVYGVTVGNKTYDGGTTTTAGELNLGGASFTGTQGSDSLKLDQTNVVGHFSQSDVGNNLAVTVSGLAVENSDGSANNNYVVSSVQGGTSGAPTSLVANITPATLTIAFNPSVSPDKVYDGTDYATLNGGDFTVTGMVGSEQVAVSQAPATYTGGGAPNVGTYDVTATLQSSDLSFTSGAKAGNYTFNTAVTGTGSITPAPLSLVIDGNPSKVYDGTSAATLGTGNFTLNGVIPGESISLAGPFTANYYNGSPGTPESNVGTWGVAAALTDGNFTAGNGTLLSNYSLPTTALGFGTITPRPVTGGPPYQVTAGITGATKVYDGSTSITLGQSNIVFDGFLSADNVTWTSSGVAGTFATKNVGTQPLTALLNGSNVSFTCGGGGTACLSNYTDGTNLLSDTAHWSITAYGSGVIQQKDLYITLSGVTKQYDGNTAVLPLGNGNFTVYGYADNNTGGTQDSGWVAGEGAAITPTASFTYASPNVARDVNGNVLGNIEVKGTLTSNNYAPIGSTDLNNYNLVYTIDQNVGRITPAPLYVTGVYAQDKIYDGGSGALLDIGNGQIAGLADRDKNSGAITLTIGTGTADTADGIAGSATGTLAPNGSGFIASGSPVSGTFHSGPNVSSGTQVIDATFTLGGSSAGNYTLTDPTLTAKITPRPLTVSGITADNKTYDGGAAAQFTFGSPTLQQDNHATGSAVAGLLSQDSGVTLNQASGTGTFATANANADPGDHFLSANGTHIAVTASGFTLDGDPNGNYALTQPTGLSADILQAPITLTLDGPIQKVYDGTTSVTIPTGNNQTAGNTSAGYHTTGWVNGEGATITQTQSASYGNADATVDGNGNAIGGGNGLVNVTANLVSSDWQPGSGTSLSNYALPTSVTSDVGVITPLVLNLSATRVYDATSVIYASLSGNVTNADNANVFGTLNGLDGDQFTVTGQGAASSKNVGTYTGGNFGLGTLALQAVGGANANNYTLVGGIDTYTITKAPLNVSGATVATKVYDGNTTASVNGATLTQGNAKGDVLGSDDVTIGSSGIAGTFNNKNAGNGKTVTINPSDVGGGDAGNYQLVQPANLTGDITQRLVTISGSRQYDGLGTVIGNSGLITWAAPGTVSGNADSGVVSGDTVKVNGGTGSVASANVGTYNSDGSGDGSFTATGLSLSNANYAIATTGNTFQITPMVLTLSGTRVYDGTADADADLVTSVNGSGSGVTDCGADCVTLTGANGETLNLAGTGTGALTSANVAGTSSSPTQVAFATSGGGITGLTLTGNGSAQTSNYVLAGGVTITPYVLSFSGSRAYDGTKKVNAGDLRDASAGSATPGSTTFSGVGSDRFTLSGTGSLSSANAGSYGGAASGVSGTPSGTGQIGVSGLTLVSVSGNTNNYTLVGGTDTYDITQAVITLTGVRQYDSTANVGNSNVTLIDGTPSACAVGKTCWGVSSSNVVTGDLVNLTVSSNSSTVSSANVGIYSDGGGFNDSLTLGGSAAGNYTLASTGNQFRIIPRVLDLSGSRVYDAKTDADAALFGNQDGTINGVNGEVLSLTGSGVISSKDVNGGTPYTGTGAAGNPTSGQNFNLGSLALGNNTGDAGNYTLVGGSDSLTLSKATLTVTGTTVADKTYNGQVNDAALSNSTLVGVLSNGGGTADDVTLGNDTTGTYASANAGTEGVSTSMTIGGGDADNYALVQPTGITGQINKAVLDLSGSRVYDAKTDADAALFGNQDGTINGVNGEVLSLTGSGVISSKDVNGGTPYTGTGAAGNPTSGQNFNLGSLALGNNTGDAGNYTLVGGSDSLTLSKATLTVTGTTVADKTYNGQVNDAALSNSTLVGVLSNGGGTADDVTLGNDTTGTYASANAGTEGVSTSMTIGGGDADNYALVQPTGITGQINKAVLDLSGSRVYDAKTDADAVLFGNQDGTINGVNGEVLSLTGSGVISSKDVNGGTPYTGTGAAGNPTSGQNFNLGSLALGNNTGDAGNYTLVGGSDSLTLSKATLTVAGTTVADKTYNGQVNDAALSNSTLVGVLSNGGGTADDVTLGNDTTGTYASANAGTEGVSTSMTIGGGDADNYALVQPTGITGQINKAVLDLSGSRVYDAKTDADAALFGNRDGTINGVNGEVLSLTGSGVISSKDVNGGTPYTGTGAAGNPTSGQNFNLGSLALGNNTGDAGNYTLVGGSDTLTLSKATLTVAGTTVADKTYNGQVNDAALSNSTLVGVLSNGGGTADDVTLGNDTTGTYASANAGTEGVSTSMTIGGGDADNYALVQPTGITGQINRAVLDLSGSRVYDAKTDADAALFGNQDGTINGVNGEVLSLTGSGVISSKDVNGGTPYTGTGAAGNPASGQNFNLGSLALGNNTGDAGNYTLVGGSDALVITPKHIEATVAAEDKTYDTTNTATVAGYGSTGMGGTGTGVISGDTVDFTSTGATFSDANAANGKTVTVDGIAMQSGGDSANYVLDNTTATTTADITPYVLGLTGQRVYDATKGAYGSDFGTVAGLGGDTFTVGGAGTVTSKNVGTYTGTGGTDFDLGNLGLVANGSALASNYTLVGGADAYHITPKAITVDATASNKTYDGNATAAVTSLTSGGVIGGDTVSFADTGATFSDANAANGKTVTVNGIAVSGTDAGNYTINATATTTADITPYVLGLTGQRVYDATTGAYGSDFGTVAGLGGDTFTVNGAGTVTSKNVGTYTGTGGTDFDLGNLGLVANGTALASNYTLAGGTDKLTITPATLTVTGTTVDTKTYDGNTTASLGGSQLAGVLGNDAVTLGNDATGTFASPNAASGIGVGTAMTIGGGDAGNYVLVQPTGVTGTIVPVVLDLDGTRVYDATTNAYAALFGSNGVLAGINGQTVVLSGTGQVASKNVSTYTGAQFGLGTLTLADGGNGGLAQNYTLAGGTDTLRITPLAIDATATAANKTYDTTDGATVTSLGSSGVLAGDTVDFSDTGATFADANAGNGKTVTVSGIALGGADAGNYVLTSGTATTTADITPYVLNLDGTRVYDATANAYAKTFGDNGVLAGLNGQTLVLSGTGLVGDKNVGTDKAFVDLGTLALGDGGNGGLAGNYTLVGGTDVLTITPLAIVVDATGTNKMFDNTTTDVVTLGSAGVLPGDQVGFGYGAANFANPNVANGTTVTVTGLVLSGADADNYVIANPDATAYTTADITGARPSAFGISDGTLASLGSVLGPTELATPYGLAPQDTVGPFTGNKKRLHRPVERNVSRDDFTSGLALKVIDGGVRAPVMAMP